MNSKYDFYLFSSNISVVAARLTTLSADISDRGVGISFESLIGLTLSLLNQRREMNSTPTAGPCQLLNVFLIYTEQDLKPV